MMFRPNNPATVDLFDAIRSDVYEAMEEHGQTVADDIRDRISVPVEYQVGPRGGTKIIRSVRGESPRTETGDLLNSVQSEVEADSDLVTVEVFSDVPYAPILENSLDRRPTWQGAAEDSEDAFLDRLVAAIEGR